MASGGGTSMNAILIGATGATGNCLLGSLLRAKDTVGKVTVLTRRKVETVGESYGVDISQEEQEGRLVQHVEDLDTVSEDTVKELCRGGNVFFNCLGTTRKKAGSAEAFRHIDYEIPLRLIKAAKQAGVCHCSLLTSVGSNPNSWLLYTKTKGQMEESTKEEKFEYTSIFRPGLLDRGQEDPRFVERFMLRIMSGMPVSTVADAMLHDAWTNYSQTEATSNLVVYNNTGIRRLFEDSKKEEQ